MSNFDCSFSGSATSNGLWIPLNMHKASSSSSVQNSFLVPWSQEVLRNLKMDLNNMYNPECTNSDSDSIVAGKLKHKK